MSVFLIRCWLSLDDEGSKVKQKQQQQQWVLNLVAYVVRIILPL
jgi:hypothetical protein